jgi:hypothetical protein
MPPTGTRMRDRLLRRWYIVVAGVLATGMLCVLAALLVPVTYKAEARIMLRPPNSSAGAFKNPYFVIAGLQPLADSVGEFMMSGETLEQLQHRGFTGSYTVVQDQTTAAPILIVTVNAATPHAALSGLTQVLSTAAPAVDTIQGSSIPAPNLVGVRLLTPATKASRVFKSRLRALVVAAAAGLVGTALIASAADELLLRRRRTRHAELAEGLGLNGSEVEHSDVLVWPDTDVPVAGVAVSRSHPSTSTASRSETDDAPAFVKRRPVSRADVDDAMATIRNGADTSDGQELGDSPSEDAPGTLFVVEGRADWTGSRVQ